MEPIFYFCTNFFFDKTSIDKISIYHMLTSNDKISIIKMLACAVNFCFWSKYLVFLPKFGFWQNILIMTKIWFFGETLDFYDNLFFRFLTKCADLFPTLSLIAFPSAESWFVSWPTVFSDWSKKVISWRKIDRKVFVRIRYVNSSPAFPSAANSITKTITPFFKWVQSSVSCYKFYLKHKNILKLKNFLAP